MKWFEKTGEPFGPKTEMELARFGFCKTRHKVLPAEGAEPRR